MFKPVEPSLLPDPSLQNAASPEAVQLYQQRAAGGEITAVPPELISSYLKELSEFAKNIQTDHLSSEEVESLLRYRVPALMPDGCSRIDGSLAEEPYDLRLTLAIPKNGSAAQHDETKRVFFLDRLVDKVTLDTAVNWLGFYESRKLPTGEALVKLVYRGIASRAEFPLTKEFARKSNNSTVGLTGKAVLINDIEKYLWKQGGPYYQCDSKVLSEACLPIFDASGTTVIGIIDAESFERNKYSATELAKLIATAIFLTPYLKGL